MSAGARCAWLSTCALALAWLPSALRTVQAFAVLARLSGAPLPAAIDHVLYGQLVEQDTRVQLATHSVRARRYVARDAHLARLPGAVLLHGVHARGIDEPRLVAFARTLARAGLDVLTPELSELLAYRLEESTVGEIRALAAAHARETRTPAVAVIGISFAGGLALMAAAQQASARPIGLVATVGAHEDLVRLCRYYAGEDVRGPQGERADVQPHPYGARVMLRDQLWRFVSPEDLGLARRALDSYLQDRHDSARQLAAQLSPEGQRVMSVLLVGGGSQLSEWLLRAAAAEQPQLVAASPHGHLRGLQVPVFLLHGARDPVIPSLETAYLAREVPCRWLRSVVVTKLLRHAEFPEPPTPLQAWQLVRFVQRLLEAAGSAATELR